MHPDEDEDTSENFPAAQATHMVAPVPDEVPPLQLSHEVAPV